MKSRYSALGTVQVLRVVFVLLPMGFLPCIALGQIDPGETQGPPQGGPNVADPDSPINGELRRFGECWCCQYALIALDSCPVENQVQMTCPDRNACSVRVCDCTKLYPCYNDHEQVDCGTSSFCWIRGCDDDTGCYRMPRHDDNDPCTDYICDEDTQTFSFVPKNDGDSCGETSECRECQNGFCVPLVCGDCEECAGGACVEKNCDDGSACTEDSCVGGDCQFDFICDMCEECVDGACVTKECDDIPCKRHECDPSDGCIYWPEPCADDCPGPMRCSDTANPVCVPEVCDIEISSAETCPGDTADLTLTLFGCDPHCGQAASFNVIATPSDSSLPPIIVAASITCFAGSTNVAIDIPQEATPGTTYSVVVEPASADDGPQCTATATITIEGFDIVIDGVSTIISPEGLEPEFDPGAFICLNSDDDDGNLIPDLEDYANVTSLPSPPTDDDFVRMTLTGPSDHPDRIVRFNHQIGAGNLRVWEESNGMLKLVTSFPIDWDPSLPPPLGRGAFPGTATFWVEGIKASAYHRDTYMRFNYAPPFAEECFDKIRWTVIEADIDVDSNNDSTIDPDNTSLGTDDPIEVALDLPGRIVFINDDDDDQDDIADLDQEPLPVGEDDLVQLDISLAPSITGGRYRLVYDAAALEVYDNTTTDIIVSEDWQDAGVLNDTLWIEGLTPSDELGDAEITLEFDADNDGLPECNDKVTLTLASIELIDMQAFGPKMNADGSAGLEITDLRNTEVADEFLVEGAVTDGASLLLIRITPDIVEKTAEGVVLSDFSLSLHEPDETEIGDPFRVGTLTDGGDPLPRLPAGDANLDTWDGQIANISLIDSTAVYRPPNNLLIFQQDKLSAGEAPAIKNVEIADIEFSLRNGDVDVARRKIILRRPPLILVHGYMSSSATWPASTWLSNVRPYDTYIAKVNYSNGSFSNLNGPPENFASLSRKIDEVLTTMRTGVASGGAPADESPPNLLGKKVAATRVDVVGHSMGGLITKYFVADRSLFAGEHDRPSGWYGTIYYEYPKIVVNPGNAYLSNDNYGAGYIRRFCTMGTPFEGSPIASQIIGPASPQVLYNLLYAYNLSTLGFDPLGILPEFFVDGEVSPASFRPTVGVADLAEGSAFLNLLGTSGAYPWGQDGEKAVRWHPMVGIAGSPVATQGGDLLIRFIFDFLKDESGVDITELNPNESDWIVPMDSQRASALPFSQFFGHSHFDEPPSVPIASKITIIMTGDPKPPTDSCGVMYLRD